MKIADKFWLWGHDAGSHNMSWGIDATSRITPVEAAHYMGISNVIMVGANESSIGASAQYSIPFKTLDKVVWSIVAAGGYTTEEERERTFKLTEHLPNMTGVMMDDFFSANDKTGALTKEMIVDITNRLHSHTPKLDLWIVLYDHELSQPIGDRVALCDVANYWTWKAKDLPLLENNFAIMEKKCGSASRKVLGCYMWDYGDKKPMPVDAMKFQCEKGLQWLKEGRIDGMVFLASCICDMGIEAVEWTRNWIREVGQGNI